MPRVNTSTPTREGEASANTSRTDDLNVGGEAVSVVLHPRASNSSGLLRVRRTCGPNDPSKLYNRFMRLRTKTSPNMGYASDRAACSNLRLGVGAPIDLTQEGMEFRSDN